MISERTFARSFGAFWQELVPLLTPRFVALFSEAYRKDLYGIDDAPLRAIPIHAATRADIVAEFAFWAARLMHRDGRALDDLPDCAPVIEEAFVRAIEVVGRYEGRAPLTVAPLSSVEQQEGLTLVRQYSALYRAFAPVQFMEFGPRFQGCGFLNAAEGDLAIGSTLIEIKTTTRGVAGSDLKQLLTYLALDACSGRRQWREIAVFNPRRGTLHRADVDALILRMSGGKPRIDVLTELAEYVQTTEVINDRKF